MKTRCAKCDAVILPLTAANNAGLCAVCGRTARAIAWRRSTVFSFVALLLPALLVVVACWQMLQRQWVWGLALPVLLPLLVFNFRLRTSSKPPPC